MATSSQPDRYPAIPLITHDPYFSIWSFSDHLHDDWAHHWTGTHIGLAGIIRVDGEPATFLGCPQHAPALPQTGVEVRATRTVYTFENAKIRLTLSFLTPALPHRLDILARPLTYLIYQVDSLDGAGHRIELYFDCGGEPCVNQPGDQIVWSRHRHPDFELLSLSSANQQPLNRSGDDLRIDWGHCYLGFPLRFHPETAIGSNMIVRKGFAQTGTLPEYDDFNLPQSVRQTWICMAGSITLETAPGKPASAWHVIAYDDVYSIEYLGRKLPGYWKLEFHSIAELLSAACGDFEKLDAECDRYDRQLHSDAAAAGGEKYAELCDLAFRQAIAAHKLVVDLDGTPLFFSKENFSNGCIATVDVTYPSAPLFLLTQPELLKGMLIPILQYAESRRWKFPFAPHDLGTYPLANGQVYGGGEFSEENQMPVEECGNMLLLAGALSRLCGETDFLKRHWTTLRKWADYLLEKGYDPDNQLCTDDFAGHLAHNTNLSLKAILALGAFAQIAEKLDEKESALRFRAAAEKFARRWCEDALDGDHYRLAFDQPGTWSQKYNLVWDRLLGLNLFPVEVARRELAFYRGHQNEFGLPLDNRKSYTKLDWILWSATLTGDSDDFAALLEPVHHWLGRTRSRVPMTDWYDTVSGDKVGFQARSVVGGVFLRLLSDPEIREKYLAMCR